MTHITIEKAKLEQWLEALWTTANPKAEEAITAIEQALAAQPAQEPVAWQVEMFIAGAWVPLGNPQRDRTRAESLAINPSLPKEHQRLVNVYATPQQRPWVGLTEAQFLEATRLAENGNYLVAFVRIQEWLKEQNT